MSRPPEHQGEAEEMLAQLALCTVSYCWQGLPAATWSALLRRTIEGVASAAVTMEELVSRSINLPLCMHAHFSKKLVI